MASRFSSFHKIALYRRCRILRLCSSSFRSTSVYSFARPSTWSFVPRRILHVHMCMHIGRSRLTYICRASFNPTALVSCFMLSLINFLAVCRFRLILDVFLRITSEHRKKKRKRENSMCGVTKVYMCIVMIMRFSVFQSRCVFVVRDCNISFLSSFLTRVVSANNCRSKLTH